MSNITEDLDFDLDNLLEPDKKEDLMTNIDFSIIENTKDYFIKEDINFFKNI